NVTDVRDFTGNDYDPDPSGADIALVVKLRITDTYNGSSQSDPATVEDFDLQAPVVCQATIDPAVGSNCSVSTTANAVVPGMIQQTKAMVLQAFRVRLNDSGVDGIRNNGDDKAFAMQGVYVP